MCAPMAAMVVITAVSTALTMYSQSQAQKAQEKSARASAEYNAQMAENEAATQEQLARNEISKGIADRERQQRAAARAMGEMRANMGASGFELDSGSNLSLLAESAAEHQYDSNVIDQNAAMAAWSHRAQAAGALNQQSYANWQYDNADAGRGATNLAMAGTLLSGIGQGIGQYNAWPGSASTKLGKTGKLYG